jgi:methylphosphotriester-DNA--protein-cysteine methyltransferase
LHSAVRDAPTIDAKMQALLQVQQMAQLVWQGHSLANAAATLGFADQAHMTRLVHEVTGMLPAMLLQRARASPFARTTGMPRVLRLAEV